MIVRLTIAVALGVVLIVAAARAAVPPTRTGVVCPGVGAFVGGGGRVEPKTILLACGDGNVWIADLKWRGWGTPTATATGDVHYNDCTPYCAAGHFHVIPGLATLTKLKSGLCRGAAARFYTHLRVVQGKRGKAIPPTTDQTLPARC